MDTALVIEDSLTDREIISRCLYQGGFKVLTAQSGEEALTKISSHQPDVIVLDIVLPGRSGFEFCRELKATKRTNKIPVVLCSNKRTELDRFWGLRQGADAYLTKPVDGEAIVRLLKQLLSSA